MAKQLLKKELQELIDNPYTPQFVKDSSQKKIDNNDYSDYKKPTAKKTTPSPKESPTAKKTTPSPKESPTAKKTTPSPKIGLEGSRSKQLLKKELQELIDNPYTPQFVKDSSQKKIDNNDYSDYKKPTAKKTTPAPTASPKAGNQDDLGTKAMMFTTSKFKDAKDLKMYETIMFKSKFSGEVLKASVIDLSDDGYKIKYNEKMPNGFLKLIKQKIEFEGKKPTKNVIKEISENKTKEKVSKKSFLERLIILKGNDPKQKVFKLKSDLKSVNYPAELIKEAFNPTIKKTTEGEGLGTTVPSVSKIASHLQYDLEQEIYDNAKANIFEAGYKYADFNGLISEGKPIPKKDKDLLAKFYKKYNFKRKPDLTIPVTNGITEKTSMQTYNIYANKTTVIAYGRGYSSLVSIDAEEGFKIWKDSYTGGLPYMKDSGAFFNGYGGLDVEESLKVLGEDLFLEAIVLSDKRGILDESPADKIKKQKEPSPAPSPAPKMKVVKEDDKIISDCKKALKDAGYTTTKRKTPSGTKITRVKRPDKKILNTKMESVFKTIEKDVPNDSKEKDEIIKTINSISKSLVLIVQSLDKLAKDGDLDKLRKIATLINRIK